MINVAIQAAPAEALAHIVEATVTADVITITPNVHIARVPLVATSVISLADCSLSAIPNPIHAERGVLAMAA